MSFLTGIILLARLADLSDLPGRRLFEINVALGGSFVLMSLGGFLVVQATSALGGSSSRAMASHWPWYPVVAFPLLLGLGQFLVNHPERAPWLFPFVNIGIVAIPSVAVALIVVHRYRDLNPWAWPVSWREWTSGFIYGASGATLVAGVINTLYLVVAAYVFIHWKGTDQFGFDTGIRDLEKPWGIIFDLSVLSVVGPLNEEFWKGMLVGLFFFRRGNAGRCFLWGVLAGTGFNLFETFFNSLTVVQPDFVADQQIGSSWWLFAIARSGTAVMHGFASGLSALGFYGLLRRKWQYAPLYFSGVATHGSWNFLVYAIEGDAILSGQGPDSTVLDVFGLVGLVVLALTCAFMIWYLPSRIRDGVPAPIYQLIGAIPGAPIPIVKPAPPLRMPAFFDSTLPGWEDGAT